MMITATTVAKLPSNVVSSQFTAAAKALPLEG
jgi:hypothetical protein